MNDVKEKNLSDRVVQALRTVFDPEIPVNIYDLGLIYNLDATEDGAVHIKMTLTSPACPVAGSLPGEIQRKVAQVEGVTDAKVELVWAPPWTRSMMTEAARLELNLDDDDPLPHQGGQKYFGLGRI